MNFSPGDIVQLKSGGPLMTVTSVTADRVDCMWFSKEGTPSGYTFVSAALAPYIAAGVEVLTAPAAETALALAALLGALARRGVTRVLAEGGAGIAAGLLRARLVDRLAWFHAPGVMGAEGRPAAEGLHLAALAAMPRFRRVAMRPLGADLLTEFECIAEVPPCSPGS